MRVRRQIGGWVHIVPYTLICTLSAGQLNGLELHNVNKPKCEVNGLQFGGKDLGRWESAVSRGLEYNYK